MPTSERRIGLHDFLAKTGRTADELSYLHRRGLFPFEAERVYYQHGSSTNYDVRAVVFLNDLAEIEQPGRRPDEWKRWHLWTKGHPEFDVRGPTLEWLSNTRDALLAKSPPRSVFSTARHKAIGGRKRNRRLLREIDDFIAAWAVDADRPDIGSRAVNAKRPDIGSALPDELVGSYYTLVLEALGVPGKLSFEAVRAIAGRGLPYWLDYLYRALDAATPEEMEQARQDWKLISDLAAMIERVDWNAAPPLPPIGAGPERKSWADRKARRKRRRAPPDDIRRLLQAYRDARMLFLPILIVSRRVFTLLSAPRIPDEMLGIARQWLNGLPRLLSPQGEATA